jgi:hypothetical protein
MSLLLGVGSAGAGGSIVISGQDVSTGPGGAVTFEVTGYSTEKIGAFGIDVYYDQDRLSVTSCQAEGVLCTKGAIPGQLRINGISLTGFSGDITFATIVFAAGDDPGVIPIGVDVTTVSDLVGQDLSQLVTSTDGSVTIDGGTASTPPGDANCDSQITAADGLALLMALSGGESACSQLADVNCDDKVNIKDALALLRALAGLPYEAEDGCEDVV